MKILVNITTMIGITTHLWYVYIAQGNKCIAQGWNSTLFLHWIPASQLPMWYRIEKLTTNSVQVSCNTSLLQYNSEVLTNMKVKFLFKPWPTHAILAFWYIINSLVWQCHYATNHVRIALYLPYVHVELSTWTTVKQLNYYTLLCLNTVP